MQIARIRIWYLWGPLFSLLQRGTEIPFQLLYDDTQGNLSRTSPGATEVNINTLLVFDKGVRGKQKKRSTEADCSGIVV